MSIKLSKRPSSKKKKYQKEHPQVEVLLKLGLENFWKTPLDPSSLLEISFWNCDSEGPLNPKDLPKAFLHRLWLLQPDARRTCINHKDTNESPNGTIDGDINPLDLVTAVLMSSNTFLQQEIIVRMVQCQFAVPMVLPPLNPEEPSTFLLWPLRGVLGQWRSHFRGTIQEGLLATTPIPVVSCVKLGTCSISKSKMLNRILCGNRPHSEVFLHRGVDGGEHPRRLSNGLVELGCYRPTGNGDMFHVPVVIGNLRGDASLHEKSFTFLCQASSAVVVFCENLREKDKRLLVSCKEMARRLILIDLSDAGENRNVGFPDQDLNEFLMLPEGSVLKGREMSEENLAQTLGQTLAELLPGSLEPVTLEAAGNTAEGLGINVDEGVACKKAMAMVEEVLKPIGEMGVLQFKQKQLPLQGYSWKKLANIQKAESKLKSSKSDDKLKKEREDLLAELSRYKMTAAMKIFTDALFTSDVSARTYFLTWMKLRLSTFEKDSDNLPANQQTAHVDVTSEVFEFKQDINTHEEDSDSFYTDTFDEDDEIQELDMNNEAQASYQRDTAEQDFAHTQAGRSKEYLEQNQNHGEDSSQMNGEKDIWREETGERRCVPVEHINVVADRAIVPQSVENKDDRKLDLPSRQTSHHDTTSGTELVQPSLGLEHFLREMGLIFELTHISASSRSHNVLRLPSLAADLLLHGVPIELMDGEASTVPVKWLGSVFAEVNRSLSRKHLRMQTLTCLGLHHARNSEVLSALFGFSFPDGFRKSTRGVYMVALCVPQNLWQQIECDFLLLVDVEGLCCSPSSKSRLKDNEMATLAAGLSDVLLLNISSFEDSDLETNLGVAVNALLCVTEWGPMPCCHLLSKDEGINSVLVARQLMRVCTILQEMNHLKDDSNKTPWPVSIDMVPLGNTPLSPPANMEYSQAVGNLKKSLNEALKVSASQIQNSGWQEFMRRLFTLWEAVKSQSFSVSLQNTDVAVAFSILCTEFSKCEECLREQIESWLQGAEKRICDTEVSTGDSSAQSPFLQNLKDEGRAEVQGEMEKFRSKIETFLLNDQRLETHLEAFKIILMRNADKLQEVMTEELVQRLENSYEHHCYSTQLNKFEASLRTQQESKLLTLVENSKSTKHLYQDEELEKEFEDMWSLTTSKFEFRPSESPNITHAVKEILTDNLSGRGLQKHIEKVSGVGQNQTEVFQIHDEYFGYRSRIAHMFEENNRPQREEATLLANGVIEEYKQFVADKSKLPADFSVSYVTEMLENVERALREKAMQIRSVFEVDLKVYLCNAACRDFQSLHDRYCKDSELLSYINSKKSTNMAEFIYHFRKRDQCQRVAQAFVSAVVEPMVLDYIHRPLGSQIAEEIRETLQHFSSRVDYNQNLLDELIKESKFESFMEYLVSYKSFLLERIGESVKSHLSGSNTVNKWRRKRLGDVIGKVAAAVSDTAEGTNGVLSDTKPLLEMLCLTLERDGDVNINWDPLNGPVFSITTEWDHFITCLMELLAAMRLNLAKQFTQNIEADKLLHSLPVDPCHCLFERVRFCERHCPVCGAPCMVEKKGHQVHMSSLHRPKGLLPNGSNDGPEAYLSDWRLYDENRDCHADSVYWRYVLVQFNENFAKEYGRQPEEIPEDWHGITRREALDGLKDAFTQVDEP
ncbi:interferon-induced very large GTPase 1 [Neosynchiropus ocellatus]